MRRLLLITLLAAITPCVSAQISLPAAPHFASPHAVPSGNRFVIGSRLGVFPRFGGEGRYRSFYPGLLAWDPLFTDALYDSGYPVASQPPVIVVQAPQPAAPAPDSFSSPTQPLMIELQGDRYVRVSGSEDSGTQMIDETASPSRANRPSAATTQQASAPELPPVRLVFRDGHQEEISSYTISDGVLYAHSDYYSEGAWNRKIELSSLNLPETIQCNRSRGIRFHLPTEPNEVSVGP